MIRVARWFWLPLTLLLFVVQAGAADTSTAELLFQKGRVKMVAQDFDAACLLFEESRALDPAVGTVMNLAACESKRGQLKRSWDLWKEALESLEDDDPRRSFAQEQFAVVDEELPRLTILAAEGAPKPLIIEQDGEELKKSAVGQERRVDPGAHLVIVKAKNHEDRRYHFPLDPGQHKKLVVAPGAEIAQPRDPLQSEKSVKTRRLLSYTAFGVAGVGAIGALVTGLLLPAKQKKVDENCDPMTKLCDDDSGTRAAGTGKALLALNTASWIVGGVALAAGGALFFTLPRNKKASDEKQAKQAAGNRLGIAIAGTNVSLVGEF